MEKTILQGFIKKRYFSFLILFFILLSCKETVEYKISQSRTDTNPAPVKVEVRTLTEHPFKKHLNTNGRLEAVNRTALHFKVNDQIVDIFVKNGQFVSQGEILAVLDTNVVDWERKTINAAFQEAAVRFQEEQLNYNYKQDSLTHDLLENLKHRTGYSQAESHLKYADARYENYFLRAPIDGLVADLHYKKGDFVQSQLPFCVLVDTRAFEVQFSIVEKELPLIKKGQTVEVYPFAFPNHKFEGMVTEINPLINRDGLIEIKAFLKTSDPLFFDGMAMKVIAHTEISDYLVIPKNALVRRNNEDIVFSVKNSLAQWNYVTIIDENANEYAISSILKPNDTIIVSGQMHLNQNSAVSIQSEQRKIPEQ